MRQAGVSNNSTVAAVLAKDLAGFGARRCFGLLGTANFKISHALVEAGVELISARHEGNAASMADAYAKATGELTLVSVHSGPGLNNAITGIGEAAKSRTPLLVLAGDVPTGNIKSNFHMDQTELVRSVGTVSERIYTPQSARGDLLRAVTCAMHDRQTVVRRWATSPPTPSAMARRCKICRQPCWNEGGRRSLVPLIRRSRPLYPAAHNRRWPERLSAPQPCCSGARRRDLMSALLNA